MTKTFIRGNERIEQLMRRPGMADAARKLDAEAQQMDPKQPLDSGEFEGYALAHHQDSL